MSKGVFNVPIATNEPVKSYIKGSLERNSLLSTYKEMYNSNLEIPLYIGGEEIYTKNIRLVKVLNILILSLQVVPTKQLELMI